MNEEEINISNFYFILKDYEMEIELKNEELNQNLELNILQNAKNKICGLCKKNIGFIEDIYNISNILNNEINNESLTAHIYINIYVNLIVFRPTINNYIIMQYKNKIKDNIICTYEPLKIVVNVNDINNNIFKIENCIIKKKINSTSSQENYIELKQNDFVIIKILDFIIKHNKKNIIGKGYLYDIITDKKLIDENFFKKYNFN